MFSFLSEIFARPSQSEPPTDPFELFYWTTFSLLGKLVIADGEFCLNEVAEVRNFIVDAYCFDDDREKNVRRTFTEAMKSERQVEDFVNPFRAIASKYPVLTELLIDSLLQVSVADGVYSEDEEDLVQQVATQLGLSYDDYAQMKFRFVSNQNTDFGDNHEYYYLLGCTPETRVDEIQACYLALRKRYDLATLQSQGYPEEILRFVEHKATRAEQAYAIVLEEKGLGRITN